MIILVVEPNKNPYLKQIDGSLKSMQEIVGGQIQAIYPFEDEVALICNEEGKLIGLPINRFLMYDGMVKDIVVGTFFLCGCPSDSESFVSLTDKQLKIFTEMFSL